MCLNQVDDFALVYIGRWTIAKSCKSPHFQLSVCCRVPALAAMSSGDSKLAIFPSRGAQTLMKVKLHFRSQCTDHSGQITVHRSQYEVHSAQWKKYMKTLMLKVSLHLGIFGSEWGLLFVNWGSISPELATPWNDQVQNLPLPEMAESRALVC